jgi:hypothetical protein
MNEDEYLDAQPGCWSSGLCYLVEAWGLSVGHIMIPGRSSVLLYWALGSGQLVGQVLDQKPVQQGLVGYATN